MPRPLRPKLTDTWYHVTNRGHNRKDVVRDEADCRLLSSLLYEATAETGIQIHSFVFMPNHIHLLIFDPDGSLSRAMKHVMGVYAQAFNSKYSQDGALWKGRFYSLVVQSEAHLIELPRYIENNPVKAGMIDDPVNYKWSSHRSLLGLDAAPNFLSTDVVIPRWFGGDLRRYESFVRGRDSALNRQLARVIESSARFDRVEDALASVRGGPDRRSAMRAIEAFVRAETGVSESALLEPRRGQRSIGRAAAITIIIRSGAATYAETADRFGLAGRSGVSSVVRRCELAADTDPELTRLLAIGIDRFGLRAAA